MSEVDSPKFPTAHIFLYSRAKAEMAGGKQRMRIASQKHSMNVNSRGNVPKSLAVSFTAHPQSHIHHPPQCQCVCGCLFT